MVEKMRMRCKTKTRITNRGGRGEKERHIGVRGDAEAKGLKFKTDILTTCND